MGPRQTEAYYPTEVSYLKSVLLWLQEYWTGPAVHIHPLRTVPQGTLHYNRRDVIIDCQRSCLPETWRRIEEANDHYRHGTTALRLSAARLAQHAPDFPV